MTGTARPKPVPLTDGLSQEYWEAVREQRLLIQRCEHCGACQFYPRRHCVACFAADPGWVQACGRGTLHSFTIVQRSTNPEFAEDCPYIFAIVELEEGVRIATRIVNAPPERLACDVPVRIAWPQQPADPSLPVFELIDTASEAT